MQTKPRTDVIIFLILQLLSMDSKYIDDHFIFMNMGAIRMPF